MQLPKELTDSILQDVLDKVKSSITPQDDTPDDSDGILGLVKSALSPDQNKDEGVMGLITHALSGASGQGGSIMDTISDLLGGGYKDEPAQQSGGIMDTLSDLLGGGQKDEPAQQSGGIMDTISDLLGGGQNQSRQTSNRDSGLLGMITDAIGGEGMVGDLLESVLRSKGVSASNLSANGALPDSIKKYVVEIITRFVLDKVKTSLMGTKASQGNALGNILDILTPNS